MPYQNKQNKGALWFPLPLLGAFFHPVSVAGMRRALDQAKAERLKAQAELKTSKELDEKIDAELAKDLPHYIK